MILWHQARLQKGVFGAGYLWHVPLSPPGTCTCLPVCQLDMQSLFKQLIIADLQDPLAIIGIIAILFPFIFVLIAIGTGAIDTSVYRGS